MHHDPERPGESIEGSRECPSCTRPAPIGHFDLAVRRPEGGERQFFGLRAALCGPCGRLVLDRETALVYGIDELDIASAIGSDRYLRPAGWAGLG
jgi:hypothetical protein